MKSLYRFMLRIFRGISGYLLTVLTGWLCFILFSVLNRMRVKGRRNITWRENLLILSNHRTMIDSFAVAFGLFFINPFFFPRLVPFNLAASENFFRPHLLKRLALKRNNSFLKESSFLVQNGDKLINLFFTWFFTHLKCLPVNEGRKDPRILLKVIRLLKQPKVRIHIFPEGGRRNSKKVERIRSGVALLIQKIYEERLPVKIIPVFISGIEEVLPRGATFPKFGKYIKMNIGPPIDFSDLFQDPYLSKKELRNLILDRIITKINELAPP